MRRSSMYLLGASILSLAWSTTQSQAQSPLLHSNARVASAASSASGPTAFNPAVAAEVRLTADAAARTAPPHGPLNLFVGEKLFEFKKGSVVEVVGRKAYGGFSGSQVWLEVLPRATTNPTTQQKTVWVLGGSLTKETVLPDGVISIQTSAQKLEK